MSGKVVHVPRLQNLSRLRVRPKKTKSSIPCAEQMAAMLGCWQTNGGVPDAPQCAQLAINLQACMQKQSAKQRPPKDTINYHLARLGKLL
ncbi:ribosomal protein subunit Mrp10 [Schizosaccharomyces japonicus yFS275]|uniref:Ribosomal protein subunit Mrp10 n=1 Tax=Schizosaccharomyces japonicus (strain yFS275 / FY16936) TaxID=402676 RepID=B6JYU7_SCHJY|nr:ribosomal protein subunit Mrp10 [Schizosaccharomyces japonicus yFS275]EEB06715.1 ribosomal protein subunit Mrp10 [Schizosaccharomyces japonicus yFS275]